MNFSGDRGDHGDHGDSDGMNGLNSLLSPSVILNSLTHQDFVPRSLSLLDAAGRFVELAKLQAMRVLGKLWAFLHIFYQMSRGSEILGHPALGCNHICSLVFLLDRKQQ